MHDLSNPISLYCTKHTAPILENCVIKLKNDDVEFIRKIIVAVKITQLIERI